MRVLLDENLPVELVGLLPDHGVRTPAELGWLQLKNGELLKAASGQFDCLLTLDKGVFYQQNHRNHALRIGLIEAVNSRIQTIEPLAPNIEKFISNPDTGKLVFIREHGLEVFNPT